jgi:CRP/FNR family transcriptional regulator
LLGRLNAEEKVASFILNISERLFTNGRNLSEFDLSMNREDLGNYLSIEIETISRMLMKLSKAGIINISNRHINILNMQKLYSASGIETSPLEDTNRLLTL